MIVGRKSEKSQDGGEDIHRNTVVLKFSFNRKIRKI